MGMRGRAVNVDGEFCIIYLWALRVWVVIVGLFCSRSCSDL